MNVTPIKTSIIKGGDRIEKILDLYIPPLLDESIIAITSKILSICQGRVVKKAGINKKDLIELEAEAILEGEHNPYDIFLTVKNNILIPSAGIDESNGDDSYILYPENTYDISEYIWNYLRQKHKVRNLGIIVTDSHTTPMRRGVTGIALGWCGFKPLYSYIGKPDIYNHPLKVTQINLLDALATSAVLAMGEGNETTPMALISSAPKIEFLERKPTLAEIQSVSISMDEDIYAPILKAGQWRFTK